MKKRIGYIGMALFLCLTVGCSNQILEESTEKEKKVSSRKISFDEPLPRDYEGTLSMWSWDDDYYTTITEAFQELYPNVTFECTKVEHKDLPQKYETALIVGS